jgi:PII-like signaling protein
VIEGALPTVAQLVEDPVATVERAQVLAPEAPPVGVAERDESGLPIWQKLMVHAEEQAKCDGLPLHTELVRRVLEAGAAGATTLRGVRGFYGGRGPFADRMLSIKRHAPMHTVIIDTPAKVRRLWPIFEEVTREAGLVTSELVPAFHHQPAAAASEGWSWARAARPWGG